MLLASHVLLHEIPDEKIRQAVLRIVFVRQRQRKEWPCRPVVTSSATKQLAADCENSTIVVVCFACTLKHSNINTNSSCNAYHNANAYHNILQVATMHQSLKTSDTFPILKGTSLSVYWHRLDKVLLLALCDLWTF